LLNLLIAMLDGADRTLASTDSFFNATVSRARGPPELAQLRQHLNGGYYKHNR
jgi:hypothetical protein